MDRPPEARFLARAAGRDHHGGPGGAGGSRQLVGGEVEVAHAVAEGEDGEDVALDVDVPGDVGAGETELAPCPHEVT